MVERFNFIPEATHSTACMESDEKGSWVPYSDYEALERENAELRAERVLPSGPIIDAASHRAETAERQLAEAKAELARVREDAASVVKELRFALLASDLTVRDRADQAGRLFLERAALSGSGSGGWRVPEGMAWREITEDDRPPNDTDVIMGCWETWPSQKWLVEVGHYGSTRGGWIHGRMTHWLPLDYLPNAPLPLTAAQEGR